MRIDKILNNNCVLSKDDAGREIVLMGRGLAYKKKKGDEVDETLVNKVFTTKSHEETTRFSRLLSEMPLEYFEFSEGLIDYAKLRLGKKLHHSIYITLTDHLSTMAERAKLGAYIKNNMYWDVKRLYRDEFQTAMEIVGRINTFLDSHFDENEAATIAMHLINAELEIDIGTVMDITKVMTEILNIVKYHFKIVYDEDSLAYYRFIIHLRFFSQRLLSGRHSKQPGGGKIRNSDEEFYALVKRKYADVYDCIRIIREFILKSYQYELPDEESIYLTIHVAKVVEESEHV